MGFISKKKTIIFQGGSSIFQGIQLLPRGRGEQLLIHIDTHRTFDFPRGGGLWFRT